MGRPSPARQRRDDGEERVQSLHRVSSCAWDREAYETVVISTRLGSCSRISFSRSNNTQTSKRVKQRRSSKSSLASRGMHRHQGGMPPSGMHVFNPGIECLLHAEVSGTQGLEFSEGWVAR